MMDANITPRKTVNKAFKQLGLLEERVRLCGASLPEASPRTSWNAVRCRIGVDNVVFPLLEVSEILEQKHLTRLPGCESWVRGVLNYRGRLLPVYGIADYFNSRPVQGRNASTQIIVIEEGAMLCGLVPDELCGMQKIYDDEENQAQAEVKPDSKALQGFVDSALTLHDETWHQLDILRLARQLYHANPTLGIQPVNSNSQI